MFITWTNQKIRKTFVQRNMFEFKHIRPFDKSYADTPGPMVVFATPGMLHAGLSLTLFKKWAPNENNMVRHFSFSLSLKVGSFNSSMFQLIMPGYCVSGTVGAKVLSGAKKVEIEPRQTIDVKLSVQVSFIHVLVYHRF